jgi:hypothetical protein
MKVPAIAHGRASHAVTAWLHGRRVPAVALDHPINHDAAPQPNGSAAIEEAIRAALSVPAGEMIHLDAPTTHLAVDRPEVQAALRHAGRLPGDPVDTLERCLDDLLACLHSPRIRRAVGVLSGALLRTPRGEMSADDVLRHIVTAMAGAGAGPPSASRPIRGGSASVGKLVSERSTEIQAELVIRHQVPGLGQRK